MPNKQNYIPVPEAMKGQIEPEGTVEIEYSLVNEEGKDYLKVTSVEGQPVSEPEEETPMSRLKNKIGYKREEEADMIGMG